MRRVIAAFALTAILPLPVLAHAGELHLAWSWDASVIVPIAVALLLYTRGLTVLRRRSRPTGRKSGPALFDLTLATLVVALLSPLDSLSDDLFSVHMVQHLLLIVVAAPLAVLSRPVPVLMWGMGRPTRRLVLRSWRTGVMGRMLRPFLNPLVAWSVFCASFIFWHIPGPYRWAIQNEVVHAVEHLCFFLGSLAFWAVVFDRSSRHRLNPGGTLLYLVSAAILSGLPGALLLFAPRPLFGVAATATALWGLTPLEDQQLAGVIMWVPMGFAFIAATVWVFLHWMEDAERSPRAPRPRRRMGARALAVPILVGSIAFTALWRGADAAPQQEGVVVALLPEAATPDVQPADAKRGRALIGRYGCGYCHTIPGIDEARGRVGPPLTGFGDRLYIAGMLRNTPDNLVIWIVNPQRIVPGNVMPVLGVDEGEALDIAAYLHSLH